MRDQEEKEMIDLDIIKMKDQDKIEKIDLDRMETIGLRDDRPQEYKSKVQK